MFADSLVRFVDEGGKEVMGVGLLPRHIRPGDVVSYGGTLDAPVHRFEVLDRPFRHHNMNSGIDGQVCFASIIIVKRLP